MMFYVKGICKNWMLCKKMWWLILILYKEEESVIFTVLLHFVPALMRTNKEKQCSRKKQKIVEFN